MAEVVDQLAEVAPVVAVGGDLAHREVGAAQGHALRVDADEDLRDRLHIEIVRETDDADLRVPDGLQPADGALARERGRARGCTRSTPRMNVKEDAALKKSLMSEIHSGFFLMTGVSGLEHLGHGVEGDRDPPLR